MKATRSLTSLLKKLHRDQSGAVSLETILVIGAVALPILVYILKFGWPKVREFFNVGADNINTEMKRVTDGQ
jgi:Flp pilus assembly pilin Flp